MKEADDKPSDSSSDLVTPLELAQLAVVVAHWQRKDQPAFEEAEEIIEKARRHLSGDRQIENSPDGYHKELARHGVNTSQITPQTATSLPPEVDEIVRALKSGKPHPEIAEPQTFPVTMISCLRLITGEKDPRRRAPWLARAGIMEKRTKIEDVFLYRLLAAKIVPHLPRFSAAYTRTKAAAAAPRDKFGKFTKAGVQRDPRGRVKRITGRDGLGRIAKNRA
jgi:hypothetical protein